MENRESQQLDGIDTTRGNESYLVLETQGELYAVKWALVKQAGVVPQTEIDGSRVPAQIEKDGVLFPVHYLWKLVGLKPPVEKLAESPAVFLEEDGRRAVLIPERILWKQEAVLHELPQWLDKAAVVIGAILLGSGILVVVLDPLGEHSVHERASSTVKCGS